MKATGVGGRQFRTDPKFGHIYDHFAVDYEYANGARIMSMCRQIPGHGEPGRRVVHRHERDSPTRRDRSRARKRVDVHAAGRRAATVSCRSTRISWRASERASRTTS